MADVAVDPDVIRMFQQVGHAMAIDPKKLDKMYGYVKRSVDHITGDCVNMSYGHRMEFRLEQDLFDELDRLTTEEERHERPPSFTYWAMPSELFFRYLRWNFSNFLYGFEYVYAQSHPSCISWERTRPMLIFLRVLRCFFGHGSEGQHATYHA
jgi:hypothetical protein